MLLIAVRTYRLIFQPGRSPAGEYGRSSRSWMSVRLLPRLRGGPAPKRVAVAVTGFVVLFALMLLRVPVGMAMGLVGVTGFAYLSGGGPALKIVGHTTMRTVTDFNYAVIPLFLLMGSFATTSGMSRELFRAANAFSAICAAASASPPSRPAAASPRSAARRSRPRRRSRASPIRRCGATAIRNRSRPA